MLRDSPSHVLTNAHHIASDETSLVSSGVSCVPPLNSERIHRICFANCKKSIWKDVEFVRVQVDICVVLSADGRMTPVLKATDIDTFMMRHCRWKPSYWHIRLRKWLQDPCAISNQFKSLESFPNRVQSSLHFEFRSIGRDRDVDAHIQSQRVKYIWTSWR